MTEEPKARTSNLKIRIISALILAPLTVAVIVAGGWIFMALLLMALGLALWEWSRLAGRSYGLLAVGALYITICFSSYIFMRFAFEQGAWLAIVVMIIVWSGDIGAYFIGRKIGGPKLAPTLSPNKTWAGFFGAMVCTALSFLLLAIASPYLNRYLFTEMGLMPVHYIPLFVVGLILGAVGQGGDLLESAFKRRAGMKDAGQIIPGHGGLLDRIDAVMLVSPVFLLFWFIWLVEWLGPWP